jgi:hypothetical protein
MAQQQKEEDMAQPNKPRAGNGAASAPLAGAFWFAGWLFTMAYTSPVWWKWIVGLVIWPYFLGVAVR